MLCLLTWGIFIVFHCLCRNVIWLPVKQDASSSHQAVNMQSEAAVMSHKMTFTAAHLCQLHTVLLNSAPVIHSEWALLVGTMHFMHICAIEPPLNKAGVTLCFFSKWQQPAVPGLIKVGLMFLFFSVCVCLGMWSGRISWSASTTASLSWKRQYDWTIWSDDTDWQHTHSHREQIFFCFLQLSFFL